MSLLTVSNVTVTLNEIIADMEMAWIKHWIGKREIFYINWKVEIK